jgi:hypothetical protein
VRHLLLSSVSFSPSYFRASTRYNSKQAIHTRANYAQEATVLILILIPSSSEWKQLVLFS